jgi:hypothetical protein
VTVHVYIVRTANYQALVTDDVSVLVCATHMSVLRIATRRVGDGRARRHQAEERESFDNLAHAFGEEVERPRFSGDARADFMVGIRVTFRQLINLL